MLRLCTRLPIHTASKTCFSECRGHISISKYPARFCSIRSRRFTVTRTITTTAQGISPSMESSASNIANGPEEVSIPMAAPTAQADGGVGGGYESDNSSKLSAGKEQPAPGTDDADADADATPKLSKNQQRKLKRKAIWDDRREDRKRKRKDKRHEKQARKREEKAAAAAEAPNGIAPAPAPAGPLARIPIALVLDCGFEDKMHEGELISMSSQVTRCYSDNRRARYQAHLYVSSYGGKMRERWETTLQSQHEHWKGVKLVEGDFVEAANDAEGPMREDAEMIAKGAEDGKEGNGNVMDVFKPKSDRVATTTTTTTESTTDREGETQAHDEDQTSTRAPDPSHDTPQATLSSAHPVPDPEPEPTDPALRNIVYLTSDSPHTLSRLEPNTSYVIGGIVDRNREKGLCYRRARERGVRTAKLPIGEYLEMASRRVLATNHVVEIMLKWLEKGDWGEAFLHVMPKRKGGKLRGQGQGQGQGQEEQVQGEDSRLEQEEDEDVDELQTLTNGVGGGEVLPVTEPKDVDAAGDGDKEKAEP